MLPTNKQLKPHKESAITSGVRKKNPADYIPTICPGILLHHFTIFIISIQALAEILSNPGISCTGGHLWHTRFLPYEALHSGTPSLSISDGANGFTLDRKCKDHRNVL
jgi:hypothetical protein